MSNTPGWECCPGKQCGTGTMHRRDFLKGTATAAGALGMASLPTSAARGAENLEAWRAALHERGERRVYRGEELTHIAFPLGGIGAGQVYLAGNGGLVSWQFLNNFHTEAQTAGAHFGVRAQVQGMPAQARLLGGEAIPGTPQLAPEQFSGEYPFAWIDYERGGSSWPLKVSMEAFNPMIPLNSKDSGIPAALFRFRIENAGTAPVKASLLATAPNLVGWDGYGQLKGPEHAEFEGNFTELATGSEGTHLHLRGSYGQAHAFERPFSLVTNQHAVAFHFRHCGKVKLRYDRAFPRPAEGEVVYWVGESREGYDAAAMRRATEHVREGATMVISGGAAAVFGALLGKDIPGAEVFQNWESGYADWTVNGGIFGEKPASGTFPGQQHVSGFGGSGLINTFNPNDEGQGTLLSPAFTVKKRYIHFLVGGGNHAGQTCVNLLVDGKAVRSAAGKNTEHLMPAVWDVQEFHGREARIEIVDAHSGGWGHVLADEILFSDSPAAGFSDAALRALLREVLPFRPGACSYVEAASQVEEAFSPQLAGTALRTKSHWRVGEHALRAGAEVWLKTAEGEPLIVSGALGKGRVVVCLGAPETWAKGFGIKTLLGALIDRGCGNTYTPQTGWSTDAPLFGSMCLSSYSPDTTVCPQWDNFSELWAEFEANGVLTPKDLPPSASGRTWNAALAVNADLAPGESREVLLALSWHFPNRTRSQHYGWGPGPLEFDHRLGNHYNNYFASALGVAHYLQREWPRLERESRAFHEAFCSTTLPRYLLDAVSANAAITRSPVYVWLEDGTVGGFEGTDSCCPMNCTHVYNYAMSMAYLFPALERNVRETDLLVQMHPQEHFIPHRTVLPLSLPRLGNEIGGPHHHALDGELGTLLKLYREWRLHGDRAWLDKMWPNAKLVMEHVLEDHDTDGDGVLKDLQANTYDTHLYGSNTFIGTLYLGALRATEELAKIVGDEAFAALCRARFESGSAGYDRICWNGEYYINVFNSHETDPAVYNQNNCYGPGCFSDQLFGQFWARLMGLGDVLPPDRVKQALEAMFKYNWRSTLIDHKHQQRVFAEGDEKALLMGTWPKGGRPEKPILYCDEVWTGIEYHVAATMLYHGMTDEALAIVCAARERYTGKQRNPWSEIECGGHYARAMSSHGVLLAASGFEYDAASKTIGIDPKLNRKNFATFFTAGTAWGTIRYREEGRKRTIQISVDYGTLELEQVVLPQLDDGQEPKPVREGGEKPRVEMGNGRWKLALGRAVNLTDGQIWDIRYDV